MSGIETGPSPAGIVNRAAAALEAAGKPLLAQAVRLLAERNEDLAVDVEQSRAALADAAQTAETWAAVHAQAEETAETRARMYRLAAENAEHYRDALQRIAQAADIEDARRIANGALS
jgi:hypothetical protein